VFGLNFSIFSPIKNLGFSISKAFDFVLYAPGPGEMLPFEISYLFSEPNPHF
jgi:hypothetical protein